jgi:lipopolysaccharide transport system permease protein
VRQGNARSCTYSLRMSEALAAARELVAARGLVRSFLARDLAVRYKGSALGLVWSLLNPLLMMAVYTVVFSHIVRVQLPHGNYPVFLLAGYLPWTFLAVSLQIGSTTLVANGGLISKVYFPREALPLSMTLANLVNLVIAIALLLVYAAYALSLGAVGLISLIPLTAFLLAFTLGLTLLASIGMVYFRDVEFLLGVGLQVWFFLTPIIYTMTSVREQVHGPLRLVFELNPARPFVQGFQAAIYDREAPSAAIFATCAALGLVSLALGATVFARLSGRIAEEL